METSNQSANDINQTAEPKTFTQEEVNSIVAGRLADERKKYADYSELKKKAEAFEAYEEGQKSELQKANDKAAELQKQLDAIQNETRIRDLRERISQETGVPANLLTASEEDDCRAQAEALKAWATPAYPQVRDGGEPQGVPQRSTEQQFAEWSKNVF